jgi:hypothetical protein
VCDWNSILAAWPEFRSKMKSDFFGTTTGFRKIYHTRPRRFMSSDSGGHTSGLME